MFIDVNDGIYCPIWGLGEKPLPLSEDFSLISLLQCPRVQGFGGSRVVLMRTRFTWNLESSPPWTLKLSPSGDSSSLQDVPPTLSAKSSLKSVFISQKRGRLWLGFCHDYSTEKNLLRDLIINLILRKNSLWFRLSLKFPLNPRVGFVLRGKPFVRVVAWSLKLWEFF